MASLTHVCTWTNTGWKRITVENAAKQHPFGTVSANSGLFMCELCGQYVSLTYGEKNIRYFKHSAHEKSKDCIERTVGASYSVSYKSEEHELPVRIVGVSATSFSFEVGLIRAPIDELSQDFCIHIQPIGGKGAALVYNKERLNSNSITYLSIGEQPYKRYTLSFQHGNESIQKFWPKELKGFDPEGTLFVKSSGIRLSKDSDVVIGREYYLLVRGRLKINCSRSGLKIKEVAFKSISWEAWWLYTVSALVFNEDAARFFFAFNCRLSQKPVALKTVWPLFIEGSFVVRHNQEHVYLLVNGNANAVETFPATAVCQLTNNGSNGSNASNASNGSIDDSNQSILYKVLCSRRQQLISAGRNKALFYKYFWKEALDQEGVSPQVSVTDINGAEIPPGEQGVLPAGKALCIKSSFDGEIILSHNEHVTDKRKMSAENTIELQNLSYGQRIQVLVGLDCVWEMVYRKQQSKAAIDENAIFEHITRASGAIIPAPHALRLILQKWRHYPRISRWIRKCLREGTINEQSYRSLQAAYRGLDIQTGR